MKMTRGITCLEFIKSIVPYCRHKYHVKKVCSVGGGGGIFPPNSSVYASQDNIRFVSEEIGCLVTGLNERMSRKFLNKTRTFFQKF